MQTRPIVFDGTPCRLGEGVCWDTSGALLWVDIPAGLVFRKRSGSEHVERVSLGQSVGCVFPSQSGRYIAGLRDGVAEIDFETGLGAWIDRSIDHDAEVRCNDGAIDRKGRLWVGVMRDDQRPGSGTLLCVDGTERARTVREGLTVPNGIAWSGDGRLMYHIDSARRIIEAVEFDADSGEVGGVVRSLRTPDGWGYPDGMTIDADGCLWVAHWAGGRVSRWDPERCVCIGEIDVPASNVTSCAFGGEGLEELYITTAMDGAGDGGQVYVCRPGAAGQQPAAPPYRPHGSKPRSNGWA